MSYAKLFSSITESSLWSEPKEVRVLFVSMLARADSTGFIEAAIPGLARLANLTIPEVESSLKILESPDSHSKDLDVHPENEGRRIIKAPGGWMIVNYGDYRERRSDEDRREYMREYMAEYRRKHSVNRKVYGKPESKSELTPLAQAETEAETIYKIYPRKVGKKGALKAISKALKLISFDQLKEAVSAYAKAAIGADLNYIPHPATWFNDARYEDDRENWKALNGKTHQGNRPRSFANNNCNAAAVNEY